MISPFLLLLRDGVDLIDVGSGELALRSERGVRTLGRLSPGIGEALRRLAGAGITEEELARQVAAEAGAEALPSFYFVIQDLNRNRLLSHRVADGRGPLATATPVSPFPPVSWQQAEPRQSYLFSRFACLRREQGRMVLDSPLSALRLTIESQSVVELCLGLATPCSPATLSSRCANLKADAILAVCSLLASAAILVPAGGESGESAEDEEPLVSWEPHDLLFHARSRFGRQSGGVGGTFRLLGRCEPLPATKPPMSAEVFDLDRPDLERLRHEDLTLSAALEDRRSRRTFGGEPVSRRQLGELLYRTARQIRVYAKDRGEVSDRPYPSGGSLYEQEIYLNVHACADLPPGLYHYDPAGHRLHLLPPRPAAAALLKEGARLLQVDSPPQVLVTIAARFARVAWKYESMAYALILKDLGVLLQTIYLVAESMGLAACALGIGNADLFAAATGIDYYAEGSIGELALGSRGEGTEPGTALFSKP